MIAKALKTRRLIPPKDDLLSVIAESFSKLKIKEKSIIVVTSKVISIWEGNCIKQAGKKNKDKSKEELIKKESNFYIDKKHVPNKQVILTIKNNILIPSAGIDESNANGYYILWPKDSFLSAKKIYYFIKKKFGLKKFGVIISDSHTTPMRTGIMGIAVAFFGFYPLKDYRGKKDIFGRKLKMSQTNIVDSLAATAVYAMGEGAEQMPIAIIEDAGDIKFLEKDFSKKNPLDISIKKDIYAPILKNKLWKKG